MSRVGQVGQDRPGRVGAGHRHGLLLQGLADLLGPGGMAPGSVLLQPGIDTCLAGLPQCGGGGPGRYGLQDRVAGQVGSQDGLEGGAGSGCARAPDAALGLGRPGAPGPGPDPAGIVRDAASSSAAVTSRRVWGMVRAAWAMTAASRLSVLALPGVRSAMRRIDTPRQVAHRDAHVSGNRHAPGAPMVAGWSTTTSRGTRRGRAGGPRRLAGPCRTASYRRCPGRWPSARP